MSEIDRGKYSAIAPALGYLYQVRIALFESLKRLRVEEDFLVSIESLDDVTFETGDAIELLQTKHHINRASDLGDYSTDFWKSLRNWCELVSAGTAPTTTLYLLLTTSSVSAQSALRYLRYGSDRDVALATQALNSVASASTNQANAAAYAAYKALDDSQKEQLLHSLYIVDKSPFIGDLDAQMREVLYYATLQKFLPSFMQRLEGWWYRRVVNHLSAKNIDPILSNEVRAEIDRLREQFKEDNLPIDDEVMLASVDASGYTDRQFVQQLRLIQIGNERIFHAIRNYFRAFEQRSRWLREDLLLVGELDRYEDKLLEEWNIYFLQMKDELGERSSDAEKIKAAQALYKWVETGSHLPIRTGVTEPSIARGSYQILSDSQRVGWHIEFKEKLLLLLQHEGAAI